LISFVMEAKCVKNAGLVCFRSTFSALNTALGTERSEYLYFYERAGLDFSSGKPVPLSNSMLYYGRLRYYFGSEWQLTVFIPLGSAGTVNTTSMPNGKPPDGPPFFYAIGRNCAAAA